LVQLTLKHPPKLAAAARAETFAAFFEATAATTASDGVCVVFAGVGFGMGEVLVVAGLVVGLAADFAADLVVLAAAALVVFAAAGLVSNVVAASASATASRSNVMLTLVSRLTNTVALAVPPSTEIPRLSEGMR
jgi:hypothetical protein